MKLAATIYGGVSDKKTFVAVKMTGDQFSHTRVLKLSKGTANQAELIALNYVLSAIKGEFRESDLDITTSSPYVMQMTAKTAQGAFAVSPEKNIELVQEVRTKLATFPRVTITSDKKSHNLAELKEAVKAFKG